MRIKGITPQDHGSRGTKRWDIWHDGFGDKARKAKFNRRDLRKIGNEILPMRGIVTCESICSPSSCTVTTSMLFLTSESSAYTVPAQRTIVQVAPKQESTEDICTKRVHDVLARLGIKPETATRSQIVNAVSVLRQQSPRPLMPE